MAVPGVVDLSPGLLGEIATYLPGRRVPGIRLTAERAEVHLVVSPSARIPELAGEVQAAVRTLGLPAVDVHVDDLREPAPLGDTPPEPDPPALPATPATPPRG
ncbi:hypothetical protein C8046_12350 [Serinibacter arcticus]|uniref:Uncharacterized protein n=1 Tax=Serinibacter arcticus TaxID=1655435 RepID=A0A2U2A002_9MICO|nr:hypothetical protein C8046_12350 [Serinibacter arcticus]